MIKYSSDVFHELGIHEMHQRNHGLCALFDFQLCTNAPCQIKRFSRCEMKLCSQRKLLLVVLLYAILLILNTK